MRHGVKGWAAGVGLGLLSALPAAAQAPAGGLKVGIVDIQQVLSSYKKRDVLQKDFESRVKSVEIQIEALKSEIKDIEEKLSSEIAQKDQGLKDRLELDLAKKKPDLEVQLRWRSIVSARENAKAMRELIDDIKVGVEEVAKREGCDLVFQQLPPNPPGKGDVMDELIRRPVIFYRKEAVLDITDRVSRQVNESFEKQPKK
jgi:Skp family chaperone for outer membrane proteins